ncbi:aryl-sulfate sulfotransferase [uncultured Psychroserpens sp.]|uniref:arylsulfotransferase family protein n=1 Tax=uncultured Psychroserpens sp. TaxID=255436 RepID=UPI0026258FC3|nr:aryl-sulfate sulfotransferase [uncultured Psychroserpens sp.]
MKLLIRLLVCFAMTLIYYSCNNDDDTNTQEEQDVELTINVEVYEETLIDDGYILAVENGATTSYLLDRTGQKVKEWNFDDNLGNDLQLLPDGKLLGLFKSQNPDLSFGGFGGLLKIINADGTTDWEYVYATSNHIAHHDVEMLPNGNVLFIAWERIGAFDLFAEGVATNIDIFPEALLEINPQTNQIVWEWHSFDHIIQDQFPAANNYGVISEHPELIDINYNLAENGDIMHANGIDYDPVNDIIFLSVNYYHEIWVIDHSTNTSEAASHSGGNYNKGGDLLYRFGNPEVYHNTEGERLFYNNHFPNLLEGDQPGAGNVLVYMNGNNINQSTVYELQMPANYELIPNVNTEPSVVWSFTDEDLFFGRISGADRLTNGNTIISEGDYGIWEVTPSGNVAWKYNGLGPKFWRCYGYDQEDQEIIDLNLE